MTLSKKSPITDAPLRSAGQSLSERQWEIVNSKLFWPLIFFVGVFTATIMEWMRYWNPSAPVPWIFTAILGIVLLVLAIRVFKVRNELRRLRMARDGERAVGEFLEKLRADGYQVFHDLMGDGLGASEQLCVERVSVGEAADCVGRREWQ